MSLRQAWMPGLITLSAVGAGAGPGQGLGVVIVDLLHWNFLYRAVAAAH